MFLPAGAVDCEELNDHRDIITVGVWGHPQDKQPVTIKVHCVDKVVTVKILFTPYTVYVCVIVYIYIYNIIIIIFI